MAHPYKKHAHKNDPVWMRGLEKYVEKASKADVTTTIRNYGGDRKTTAEAVYDIDEEKS
jgi:hypothetical protein